MTRTKYIVLVLVAIASTAFADEGREIKIEVEVNGNCTASRKSMTIVVDGDEANAFPLKPVDTSGHVWIGLWHDTRASKFPLAPLSASLRLDPGRTYCQYATAKKDAQDAIVASFIFQCDQQTVRDVAITTRPPIIVSYVRRLPKRNADDGLACPCLDGGTFQDGEGIVEKVRFPIESFRLQLGAARPDSGRPGLLILDADGTDVRAAAPAVLDASVRRNGRPCNGEYCLKRDDVVKALREQSARGLASVPPLFSSAAYDLDQTVFSGTKLDGFSLTVK
jgi:hypothetical protein